MELPAEIFVHQLSTLALNGCAPKRMTISNEDRQADIDRALVLMLAGLGEHFVYEIAFRIEEPPFDEIKMTTWATLEKREWAKSTRENVACYWLTPKGWIAALKASGKYDEPELIERAQKLAAALKECVKGRELEHLRGVLTDHWELTARTQLPVNWLLNALDSQLLDELWPGRNMRVIQDRKSVRVPIDFGQTEL